MLPGIICCLASAAWRLLPGRLACAAGLASWLACPGCCRAAQQLPCAAGLAGCLLGWLAGGAAGIVKADSGMLTCTMTVAHVHC